MPKTTAITALAILDSPGAKGIGKMKSGDKNIWLLKKRGWTNEQLAGRFGVKETAIQAACDRYELYRDGFANTEVDFELNKMVTGLMPKVEKVLTDGMKAEHTINVGKGKRVILKKFADHATRLKTLEVMKALRETTQPRGGGIQVNTQINSPGNPNTPVGPRGFDFEARLRKIREEEGLSNNDDVIDADWEEPEQSTAAEELADIGLDIDDDEDEDDEA